MLSPTMEGNGERERERERGAMEVSMLFSRSLTYSSLLPSNAVPSTTSCIHSTVLPHCSTHLVLSRQGTRLPHS